MIINYLKIALRNIRKNKGYSFINITGLAVGIAVFILIALFVRHELSFDTYHAGADRIYRVIQQTPGNTGTGESRFATTAPALGPALVEEFPGVRAATRFGTLANILITNDKKGFLEPALFCTEAETFDIFSIPFVRGNPETALKDPFSILLSEDMAKKYFGDGDPMGKVLVLKEKFDFKVTGVFKNMPRNSHFVMDVVIPFKTYFQFKFGPDSLNSWSEYSSFYTYFLLREGAGPVELEKKFPALLDKYKYRNSDINDGGKIKYLLQPLTSIHLYSDAGTEIGTTNSDIKYVYLFSAIAFLVLVIACINYMNLATARSFQRGKEVGLRKVVGADRGQLIVQFLGESLFYAFSALAISTTIVSLVLPAFNNFLQTHLRFNPVEDPQILLVVGVVLLFTGVLAGSYPALYISSFRPITILRGTFNRGSRGALLRKLLVMVQFSVTIVLIIGTLVISDQRHFIKNKDMGYDREQILVLHVGDKSVRHNFHKKLETIKAELKQNPGVLGVSASKRLPNDINLGSVSILPGKGPGSMEPIYAVWGDRDFIGLYGIEVVEGRNFSTAFPSDADGAILINEAAARVCRWESPIGKELTYWGNRKGTIVGIMKDFHFHSLHSAIKPLCIYYEPLSFDYLSIKVDTVNMSGTIGHIEGVMKKFSPSHPFEYFFFDELFDRGYLAERKVGSIFGIFAFLSIVIACLGLFGLASFMTEQRTKEVGIRKVVGASGFSIVVLFSREFSKWVLIANLIAWPVGYFVMEGWLGNFVYRTGIGFGVFLSAGLLAFVVALLTVGYQSIRASAVHPIDLLRHE